MKLLKLILFAAILGLSYDVSAQIHVDLKGKLNDQLNDRANKHVDNAIDKGLDAIEEGVANSVNNDNNDGDNNDDEDSESENKSKKAKDSDRSGSTDQEETVKPVQDKVSILSSTKYDFVPGDKVLFFEDFSQDAVGDFPALWTTNGSGEVKTVNIAPGNWLHMNTEDAVYAMTKEIPLPENFIFECDVITAPKDGDDIFDFSISFFHANDDYRIDDLFPGDNGFKMGIENGRWWVQSYSNEKDGKDGESTLSPVGVNELHHIIAWVQKGRIRIYHSGQKVIDLPTFLYTPINYNHLRFSLWSMVGRPYVTNIRITTAGADTRSKLLTEGKLISYGIYFDVNKDAVKAESFGALNDIAKILKENPEVRIKIVGHTDSDGADASNLDLSKRRGASVKNELVKTFGIDASRLESDGKGESVPIAPNDTPSNKSLNRRVEFIKL
ncbi:MAG: OmpA family protein [Bacteroidales bacterium]|nr:OmpA family protein [Bacteroidales bacterium]